MISSFFNTIFYIPLYNLFVFLVSISPFNDIGIAIVALTLFVRLLLLPVTHKSVKAQVKMKILEPEINAIKKETEKDKQTQARRVMELYQKHGVNPFSGCLLFLIQMPFIFALFWIFNQELVGGLSHENLYSFIRFPQNFSLLFLGIMDVTQKNLIIALCAGASQYFQIRLALPPSSKKGDGAAEPPSFKDEFAKSFQLQMKYIFPVMVFFLSYSVFSSGVALYWTTSNLISIIHELLVRKKARALITTHVAQST